jgi:hypothetical protein
MNMTMNVNMNVIMNIRTDTGTDTDMDMNMDTGRDRNIDVINPSLSHCHANFEITVWDQFCHSDPLTP